MGKDTTRDLYSQVYGKDFDLENGCEGKHVKSDEELKTSSATRSPRATFKEGDKVIFPTKIVVVSEDTTIGKWSGKVESFAVYLERDGKRQPLKFFIGWLDKTGYDVFGYGATIAECKSSFNANTDHTPLDDVKTNNVGSFVEAWQEAANQKAACTAIAGKTATVSIVGYLMGAFDAEPKAKLSFD